VKNGIIGLIILSFGLFSACKKADPNWRKYEIELTDLDVEQTEERTAIVRYAMTISGNPRPEITEFGLIVTANPEAPFHGLRFPSEQADDLIDYSFNLND
jgi:hypothetical protein